MGGRGAASGMSDKGRPYGSEYSTVFQSGNIKFIKKNEGSATAPLETMTKGRVYVTLGSDNVPRFISYHDKTNGRKTTIDLIVPHNGEIPHAHNGYFHNENDSKKGYSKLTTKQRKMVDRINELWLNYINGK